MSPFVLSKSLSAFPSSLEMSIQCWNNNTINKTLVSLTSYIISVIKLNSTRGGETKYISILFFPFSSSLPCPVKFSLMPLFKSLPFSVSTSEEMDACSEREQVFDFHLNSRHFALLTLPYSPSQQTRSSLFMNWMFSQPWRSCLYQCILFSAAVCVSVLHGEGRVLFC